MIRKSLGALALIAVVLAAGNTSAIASHRPPPSVTITTCHTDAAGVSVCVQRRVLVRWVRLGVPTVKFGSCGKSPTVTVLRSGAHIDYTVDTSSDSLWFVKAHTTSKRYRLRLPADGWQRITRRTAVALLNMDGPSRSCHARVRPPYQHV